VYTLVNQADEDQAVQVVARINRACERFLDRSVQLAGHVVHDRTVADAAAAERPYLNRAPEAIAARLLESIAERLLSATARNSDGRSEADSKLGSAAA
jgi:flagellar biosynthesis protein FlhG